MDTKQLDELVTKYKAAKDDYTTKKRISNDAHHYVKQIEGELLMALESCDKSKYIVDGLGTIRIEEKCSVKVPKTIAEKKAMLQYIEGLGKEIYAEVVSVHSATLNKLYNELNEEAQEGGMVFDMPGVEAPTVWKELRFKKG